MNRVRIQLNRPAIRQQLLQGADIVTFCEALGNAALGRLGSGYSMNTYQGRVRANVEVKADTREAVAENLSTNSLIKAVFSK